MAISAVLVNVDNVLSNAAFKSNEIRHDNSPKKAPVICHCGCSKNPIRETSSYPSRTTHEKKNRSNVLCSTCDAITSMRFKTAINAVTSFGAMVLIIVDEFEPANDV